MDRSPVHFIALLVVRSVTALFPIYPTMRTIVASSKTEFYSSVTESESDRNNGSIVMKIIYGDTSCLFTGDAEREEEQEILHAGYDLSATALNRLRSRFTNEREKQSLLKLHP